MGTEGLFCSKEVLPGDDDHEQGLPWDRCTHGVVELSPASWDNLFPERPVLTPYDHHCHRLQSSSDHMVVASCPDVTVRREFNSLARNEWKNQ